MMPEKDIGSLVKPVACTGPVRPQYQQRSRTRKTTFCTNFFDITKVIMCLHFHFLALSYCYFILSSFYVKTHKENEVSTHSYNFSRTPVPSEGFLLTENAV